MIVAAKQITVYDDKFNKIAATTTLNDRVYGTHVVADLDGDGVVEIAAGSRSKLLYQLMFNIIIWGQFYSFNFKVQLDLDLVASEFLPN